MSTLVMSSYQGTPGSSAVRVQVMNASDGAVLLARTGTGVREDVAGTGFYVWSGVLADAAGYEAVWDEGGATFQPPGAGEVVLPVIQQMITPVPSVVQTPAASGTPGTFKIKRHDTREPLVYQALEGSQPVDITGATILFKLRVAPDDGAGLIFSKPAAAVPGSAASGWMSYQWAPGDTAQDGTFDAEFEVTFPDGRVKTFPTTAPGASKDYITVIITKDLD